MSVNTVRYIRLLEEAADSLITEERVFDDDVIDVLQVSSHFVCL